MRVILHLSIPGTVPRGYPEFPDQLRGVFLTAFMKWCSTIHPLASEDSAMAAEHMQDPS